MTGGERMVWTTSTLSEELEKLLNRISDDLASTLVNLDGSLKDIDNGTHIRIPTDAGYVNCYKSVNSLEISIWLKDKLTQIQENLENYNQDDEI